MSLAPEVLAQVEDFIRTKSTQILDRLKPRTIAELRAAMPFHALFFGDQGLVAAANQRSIVTKMGQSLYPGIAKIIVERSYRDVIVSGRRRKGRKSIEGQVSASVPAVVSRIIQDLYHKRARPDHEREMASIIAALDEGERRGEDSVPVNVEPDLYVGDFSAGPLFIELKTPLSNKDVCAESKQKLLTYLAIMHARGIGNAEAYLGLTYNPYVERGAFKWWPVLQMMDMDRQVLIGEEVWDKLGGPGTFSQILETIVKIRSELSGRLT